MQDPVAYLKYSNNPESNEIADMMVDTLRQVARDNRARCRLCDVEVEGEDMGEILEQLGLHGEMRHPESWPVPDGAEQPRRSDMKQASLKMCDLCFRSEVDSLIAGMGSELIEMEADEASGLMVCADCRQKNEYWWGEGEKTP